MNGVPKILIIDDEWPILHYMEMGLKKVGFEVITAMRGQEAIDKALSLEPDLILLDINLPDMSGLEVCRLIKAQSKVFIPIILVSVFRELKNKVKGMNHGADDYLTKPFVLDELNTRVRSMLRIKMLYDRLKQTSVTDELTGAYNRRYLLARLKEECARSQRYNSTFSCLMMDLDHFKKVNDTYGHPVGDELLKDFVDHVQHSVRRTDILTRYGGEEFILILPESSLTKAKEVAEIIRSSIEKKTFICMDHTIRMTCSIGICSFSSSSMKDHEELLQNLDDSLYQAKQAGRNTIQVYSHPLKIEKKRIFKVPFLH